MGVDENGEHAKGFVVLDVAVRVTPCALAPVENAKSVAAIARTEVRTKARRDRLIFSDMLTLHWDRISSSHETLRMCWRPLDDGVDQVTQPDGYANAIALSATESDLGGERRRSASRNTGGRRKKHGRFCPVRLAAP